MLQVFLDEPGVERLTGLARVVASGEALPPELVRRFRERLPQAALDNLYGPTEAAVDVSWWPCEEAAPRVVPIGRPIDNLRLHVVDRRLAPQPIGVPGELLLGGVGLARGYHGRPGLTAERWVPDPFATDFGAAGPGETGGAAPGGRLYRTGDLARWRADGSVEYLGRLDHQFKLRGLRIELGEIEAALLRQPQVAAAAAGIDRSAPGDARLVAWIVPRQAAPPVAAEAAEAPTVAEAPAELAGALRAALRRELPDGMVPTLFVTLPALPTTPSGKVDRRALPAPALDGAAAAARWREPETAAEKLLAEVWSEVLRRERVGAGDDFFALGGHSLLAAQVVARLAREIGLELPLRQVFETPVLADLAAAVDERLLAEDAGEHQAAAAAVETETQAAGTGEKAVGDGSREVAA
jgi:acyl-CoA synthetase (AMP-forming)/AMP-acid ligase II